MSPRLQALCCECGELRTCTRPRNHIEDNYWLRKPVDRDWHRETGDLKCANCGRITRHAIILPDGHWAQNHAEKLRKAGTGWYFKNLTDADLKRIQERWHDGQPRNPRTWHQWFRSAEDQARAAGRTHLRAVCKALVPVPKRTWEQRYPEGGLDRDVLVKPTVYDPEPDADGWEYVQCVDCLYRSNQMAIDDQRKELKDKLLKYAGKLSTLDPATVISLVEQFRAAEADQ